MSITLETQIAHVEAILRDLPTEFDPYNVKQIEITPTQTTVTTYALNENGRPYQVRGQAVTETHVFKITHSRSRA